MKGTCRNGDECAGKHVPDCNFFKKGAGSCTKGKECSFRHFDPSKTTGAPSSPTTPRGSDSRGRSPTPKKARVCLRSGVDNVQQSLLPDDDVKGALAVAARKIRFHDTVIAQTHEYDPSEHFSFKSMKSQSRRQRKFSEVIPQSEVEKLYNTAVSCRSSKIARKNS